MGKDDKSSEKETLIGYDLKLSVMLQALGELCIRLASFGLVKSKEGYNIIDNKLVKKLGNKPYFSDLKSTLLSEGRSVILNEFLAQQLSGFNASLNYREYFDLFSPDFAFSKNPEKLTSEILILILLYMKINSNDSEPSLFDTVSQECMPELPQREDPYIDCVLMKALFFVGRMVENLEHEGHKRGNTPKKIGSLKRKGYIDEQIYFDLLYSDQFEVLGKTPHATCENIRKEAIRREEERSKAKNEKPKKVKSNRRIIEVLKTELDKLFS